MIKRAASSFAIVAFFLTSCTSSVNTVPPSVQGEAQTSTQSRTDISGTWRGIDPPIGNNRVVSDSQVDSLIDSGLSPEDHAIVKSALLSIAPSWRSSGVIIRLAGGRVVASRRSFLLYSAGKPQKVTSTETESLAGSPPSGVISATNACPTHDLGGYSSGAFRRVYIGCTGYYTQEIQFLNPDCDIGDQIQTGTDFHNVLGGAYNFNLTPALGIDAGLVWAKTKETKATWQAFTIFNSTITYGGFLPCGAGTITAPYQIELTIEPDGRGNNEWVLSASGGGTTSPNVVVDPVTSGQFALDGSNFIFRRLTGIAQQGGLNVNSQEWFGFLNNASGGPNRSVPEIEYYSTTTCCDNGSPVQWNYNTNSYGERNPQVYNNTVDVICSEDPYWAPIDFNTYEGLNLHNPNASGTMPGTNCYTNGTH